jgi:hypothetical protein
VVSLKRHPVHIDDQASEGIIENTFLDLKICFGSGEAIKGGFEALVPPGETIEDQKACQEKSGEGENGNGKEKLIQTHSRGFKGSNFAIAG